MDDNANVGRLVTNYIMSLSWLCCGWASDKLQDIIFLALFTITHSTKSIGSTWQMDKEAVGLSQESNFFIEICVCTSLFICFYFKHNQASTLTLACWPRVLFKIIGSVQATSFIFCWPGGPQPFQIIAAIMFRSTSGRISSLMMT